LVVPSTAIAGALISVTDTVRSQGGEIAGASTVRFYLSLNLTYDASDTPLGDGRPVGPLGINVNNAATTQLTLPTGISGRYYIIAVADADGVVTESSETNNTIARVITINQ
jgi:subtilase family serine protease